MSPFHPKAGGLFCDRATRAYGHTRKLGCL